MMVRLSPEQQRWLEAQVEAGHFTSVEEAVAVAVADLMTAIDDQDGFEWAKPLVDEAVAEIDRGEGIPAEEAWARIRQGLKQ